MARQWKIIIADDVLAIREGVVGILERVPGIHVSKMCSNSQEAEDAVAREHFDLAMLDLQLGDENGIVLGRSLKKLDPTLRVINYTKEKSIVIAAEVFLNDYTKSRVRAENHAVTRMVPRHGESAVAPLPITTGLNGYLLLKNITPINFSRCLDKLEAQGSVVDSEILDMIIERLQLQNLTPRETQCSELITLGKSNKEIAAILGITQQAVENLINSLYSKLSIEGEPKDPGRRVLLAHAMERWFGLRDLKEVRVS